MNATPVGMYPGNGAVSGGSVRISRLQGVLDVIYNPRRTALLLQAEARGIPCSDGLPMLVAQAVAAEERFFNRSIPAGENERILVQLRREMTNLILIGMPGSGKTTVGEALSRLTGREAVDMDQMIETDRRLLHPGDLRRVKASPASGPGSGPPRRRLGSAPASSSSPAAASSRRRKTTRPSIRTAASISWCGISACCPPRAGPLSQGADLGRHVAGAGAPVRRDSGTRRSTTTARWRTPPPPSGGIFVNILVS